MDEVGWHVVPRSMWQIYYLNSTLDGHVMCECKVFHVRSNKVNNFCVGLVTGGEAVEKGGNKCIAGKVSQFS